MCRALGAAKPALVVVPLSTLPNWMAELKGWTPHLYAVRLLSQLRVHDCVASAFALSQIIHLACSGLLQQMLAVGT